jgi:hypothetical protein
MKHYRLLFEDKILSWDSPRVANDWVRHTFFQEASFHMRMLSHLVLFSMGIATTTELFTSFSFNRILIGSTLGILLALVVYLGNKAGEKARVNVTVSSKAVYLGDFRVTYDKLDRFNIFTVEFENEPIDILAINGKKDGSTIIAGVGAEVNRKDIIEVLSKRLSLDESIQIKEYH